MRRPGPIAFVLILALAAAALAACSDGDAGGQRIVDRSLVRLSDLPGSGWQDAGGGDTVFELTDFLGLSDASLRASPTCAPYRDRIERRLIDFAHVPTRGSGAAAWRSGDLPLNQILIAQAIAVYDSPARARRAAGQISAIFDDVDAAACLNDLAAGVGEGLVNGQARPVAPLLTLPEADSYAFVIEALVLILLVSAEIEAHVVVQGEALALYLVVDFNTRFLERDAQSLVDALQQRLSTAVAEGRG